MLLRLLFYGLVQLWLCLARYALLQLSLARSIFPSSPLPLHSGNCGCFRFHPRIDLAQTGSVCAVVGQLGLIGPAFSRALARRGILRVATR
jgi:nitrate/nitrite transporter NarK